MFVANFLLGLFLIAAGVVMLKLNFQLTNLFSHNNAIERRLGPGSMYLVMQFIAILVVIYGLLLMFGLHDNILG